MKKEDPGCSAPVRCVYSSSWVDWRAETRLLHCTEVEICGLARLFWNLLIAARSRRHGTNWPLAWPPSQNKWCVSLWTLIQFKLMHSIEWGNNQHVSRKFRSFIFSWKFTSFLFAQLACGVLFMEENGRNDFVATSVWQGRKSNERRNLMDKEEKRRASIMANDGSYTHVMPLVSK